MHAHVPVAALKALAWAAPLAGAGSLWLVAEAALAPDGGQVPTTILGAFIALSMGAGGLVAWVLKRQFAQIERMQQQRDADREAWLKALETAVAATRAEGTQSRSDEAEQHAVWADEERKLRQAQHDEIKALLQRALEKRGS